MYYSQVPQRNVKLIYKRIFEFLIRICCIKLDIEKYFCDTILRPYVK